MDRLGFLALAVVAGGLFPLQALINARLGASVGGPIWAAFFSFLVGTLVLAAVGLAVAGPPRVSGLMALPWWVWTGGFTGALLVFTTAFAAPHLGTAVLLAAIVTAQLLSALLLDRYGVLQPVRPLGTWQIVGAALLVAGMAMIVLGPRR